MMNTASPFYNDGTKLFRWNWGGFIDPLAFGFAHRAYKTYLFLLPSLIPCILAILWGLQILPFLVPVLSIPLFLVWNIGCGAMGERMAWTVGLYEDGVAFRASMDAWNRAGRLHFVLRLIILTVLISVGIVVAVMFDFQIQDLQKLSISFQ